MTTNNLFQVKRKFLLLIFQFAISVMMFSQVPNIINYQAVARNNAGQALANQSIKVRLSIFKNAVSFYSETRELVTNPLGLFNVQIGSPGALATTGDFTTINWQNNANPGYVLKVELDATNSGLYTEMGFQKLVSVPYAFASKEANHASISDHSIEADSANHATTSDFTVHADTAEVATEVLNINGKPVDTSVAPITGSRLMYDGLKWKSVKKDSVIMVEKFINNIPAIPGNPWQWVASGTSTNTITLSDQALVIGHFTGSFGHAANVAITVSVAVCYQELPSGPITEFNNNGLFMDVLIHEAPLKMQLTTPASKILQAGDYKIGMCIKNKSVAGTNLTNNDILNGVIEIRY